MNIRMRKLLSTDKEVEVVVKTVGCDTFIQSLEKSYKTKMGSGGAYLSGGER